MPIHQQRINYKLGINKNMEFKELINKEKGDLEKLLVANRSKLRELRFKDSNKQLKNIREIRSVRQLIARILTTVNKQK